MVRLLLDMCVTDLLSPTDIYVGDDNKKRLLVKKGMPLSERTKELLYQNKIQFLDFPLPYETEDPPPYTFSEETEAAVFRMAKTVYSAYKSDSVENPLDIRKEAYDILAQAYQEFRRVTRTEYPATDIAPRRYAQSILHLRTVGALEDYLFEHAKNVSLLCLVLAWDYFYGHQHHLAEIHKVSVAGLFADIGMMKVPPRILKKEEPLTEKEIEIVHEHSSHSAQFVETLFRQQNFITAQVVRHHHERCNGSGYPAQLSLKELEPYTLLLAVADSYISMISKRYFRQAKNPLDAIRMLNAEAGTIYEGKAVQCLNYRVAPYPIGSVVRFADQKLVQVVDLENIPLSINDVQILKEGMPENPYNIPKHIRAFVSQKTVHDLKKINIRGYLDKMGSTMDPYDLLSLYGYIK